MATNPNNLTPNRPDAFKDGELLDVPDGIISVDSDIVTPISIQQSNLSASELIASSELRFFSLGHVYSLIPDIKFNLVEAFKGDYSIWRQLPAIYTKFKKPVFKYGYRSSLHYDFNLVGIPAEAKLDFVTWLNSLEFSTVGNTFKVKTGTYWLTDQQTGTPLRGYTLAMAYPINTKPHVYQDDGIPYIALEKDK